jgi:hypothetical protein
VTSVDRRQSDDLSSVQREGRSSVRDFAVVLTSDDSHLEREPELCRERYGQQDAAATPLSAERRMTAEIGILRNGIDH